MGQLHTRLKATGISLSREILDELREIEEELERLRHFHHHHHHPRPAVFGRFAGFYHTDPKGNIIMAVQQLTVNTPFTAPLIFLDANGNTTTGPVGTVTASDTTVTVGLSADGQACNVTMTTTVTAPVTLTWHDPAGVVPDFITQVTDQPVILPAVTGSFGTFVAGTTP